MALVIYGSATVLPAAAQEGELFFIEASLKTDYYSTTAAGRFRATGAFRDSGSAWAYSAYLALEGKDGDLLVEFWHDPYSVWDGFTIIDGTGEYADLVGISGSAGRGVSYSGGEKPMGRVTWEYSLWGVIP
jgi:hypothetical protein